MRVECEKIGLKRSIERVPSKARMVTALLHKADAGQTKGLNSLPQFRRQTEMSLSSFRVVIWIFKTWL